MQRNYRINNSHRLKENNRFAILNLLRKNGAMSRKDIANQVMLTQASVTILTGELISEGILLETGVIRTAGAGRSKILLNINYQRAYVLGVTIDTTGIDLALAGLQGEILHAERASHRSPMGTLDVLEDMAEAALLFLEKHRVRRDEVGCAGVGIIGLVDAHGGVSLDSYGVLPPNAEVAAILHERLGFPVAVDNLVRGIAMAELDFQRAPVKLSGLFVKYGPGVGSAIIVDSEIYYGISHRSGEIGHCIVEPTRERCICGKRGCLERLIGLDSLKAQAAEVFNQAATPHLYALCDGQKTGITIENIVEAADRGDAALSVILEKALFYLAMMIVNAIEVVDGQQVVLFGYLFHKDWACRRLSEIIGEISDHRMPIELIKSVHIGESPSIGSVAVAIRHYFASV